MGGSDLDGTKRRMGGVSRGVDCVEGLEGSGRVKKARGVGADRKGSMEGMQSGRLACLRMGVLSGIGNNILLALARIHTEVARGAR